MIAYSSAAILTGQCIPSALDTRTLCTWTHNLHHRSHSLTMPSAQEDDQHDERVSWKIIALLILIVLLAFISFMISMVSSMIMPKFDLPPETLASVSGYYGPGSVAAWLVLAFSNSEFMVLIKVISRLMTGRIPLSIDDVYDLKVDTAIIGTLAYPLVAYVDLTIQIIAALKSEKSWLIEHRIEAQLAVAHLSSAVSVLAMIAHYYFLLIYLLINTDENFERTYPGPMMRKRRARLAMWTTIFMSSQICIAILSFKFRATAIKSLKHYSSMMVVTILATTLLIPDGESEGGSTKIAWAFCCILFLLLLPSVNFHVGKEFDMRFPWPQSPARLSDLDQASALAVSLCTTLASLAKWVARQVEKNRTSSAESGDEKTNDEPHQATVTPYDHGTSSCASRSIG